MPFDLRCVLQDACREAYNEEDRRTMELCAKALSYLGMGYRELAHQIAIDLGLTEY